MTAHFGKIYWLFLDEEPDNQNTLRFYFWCSSGRFYPDFCIFFCLTYVCCHNHRYYRNEPFTHFRKKFISTLATFPFSICSNIHSDHTTCTWINTHLYAFLVGVSNFFSFFTQSFLDEKHL